MAGLTWYLLAIIAASAIVTVALQKSLRRAQRRRDSLDWVQALLDAIGAQGPIKTDHITVGNITAGSITANKVEFGRVHGHPP